MSDINKHDYDHGYSLYCEGKKIPSECTAGITEGWWAACDAREKFGKYDSFLFAED